MKINKILTGILLLTTFCADIWGQVELPDQIIIQLLHGGDNNFNGDKGYIFIADSICYKLSESLDYYHSPSSFHTVKSTSKDENYNKYLIGEDTTITIHRDRFTPEEVIREIIDNLNDCSIEYVARDTIAINSLYPIYISDTIYHHNEELLQQFGVDSMIMNKYADYYYEKNIAGIQKSKNLDIRKLTNKAIIYAKNILEVSSFNEVVYIEFRWKDQNWLLRQRYPNNYSFRWDFSDGLKKTEKDIFIPKSTFLIRKMLPNYLFNEFFENKTAEELLMDIYFDNADY